MNRILPLALCILVSVPAMAQKKKAAPVKQPLPAAILKTNTDSTSYWLGYNIAKDAARSGFELINYKVAAQAFKDFFEKKPAPMSPAQGQAAMQTFEKNAARQKNQAYIAEQNLFLAQTAKRPGIQQLPGGILYEVLSPGSGPKPAATDEVTVNYIGKLANGKEFDNSYTRGEAFTTTLGRVIKGWQIAIPNMPKGAKYRFYIPAELAYGSRQMGNDIPAFSTLVFDIELLKINDK